MNRDQDRSVSLRAGALVLLLAATAGAEPPPAATTETAGGLRTTTFHTDRGEVVVHLPDDLAAGDTVSGAVKAWPSGSTAAAMRKNGDRLRGYVVELEEHGVGVGFEAFTWQVPEDLTETAVILRDRRGRELARGRVPVAAAAATTTEELTLPSLGQSGWPLAIGGAFDGRFADTAVTIGGEPARLLAESPRELIAESPAEVIGPVEIVVTEGENTARGELRAVAVDLSAPKLDLRRGETTTLTVRVSGLEGLEQPLPLTVVNHGPEGVRIAGGDEQRLTITPESVGPRGDYLWTTTLTGISPGGFEIVASVPLPTSAVADSATTTARTLSTETADGPCEEAEVQLAVVEKAVDEAAEDLVPALDRAMDAVEKRAAALRRAGAAAADSDAAAARTREGERGLAENDRVRQELERSYEEGIREAEDAAMRARLTSGRERMRQRYDRRRQPLAEEVERLRDAEQLSATSEDRAAKALEAADGVLAAAEAALRAALAAYAEAKEALVEVAVRLSKCFPCTVLQMLAAGLDDDRARLHDLLRWLDDALDDARHQLAEAESPAEQADDDLGRHDQAISDARQALADMEAEMRRRVESGLLVDGVGLTPDAGPNSIGLLPDTELRTHFMNGRADLVGRFLRSDAFQDLRRDFVAKRRELAVLESERIDKAAASAQARAALDSARARVDGLEALLELLLGAGLEDNVEQVLARLEDARSECLAELRDCLRRLAERRRHLRRRTNDLRRELDRLGAEKRRLERQAEELDEAAEECGALGVESLDRQLRDLEDRLREAQRQLDDALAKLADLPEPPTGGRPDSVESCRRLRAELDRRIDEVDDAIADARGARDQARRQGDAVAEELGRIEEIADRIFRYREASRRYRDCLERKEEALARLQEIYVEDRGEASELLAELRGRLAELGSELGELENLTGAIAGVEALSDLSRRLGDELGKIKRWAGKLETLTRLGQVLESLFRAGSMTPAESAEAFAQAFEVLSDLVPKPPVLEPFFDFYKDALDAIAAAIGGLQRRIVERWLTSGLDLDQILDGAPVSLHDEIRRAYEIRDLLRLLEADCGPPPRLDLRAAGE